MDKLYTNVELDNMDYYIRVHGDAIIKPSARNAWYRSIRLLIKQARLANKKSMCQNAYKDGYWTGRQDGIWQEIEAKEEKSFDTPYMPLSGDPEKKRKSRKYWKRKAMVTERQLLRCKELLTFRTGLFEKRRDELHTAKIELHEARMKADANYLKLKANHPGNP